MELNLPPTVAGYACPICPHCDRLYGPEVADAGPIKCRECGTWFRVSRQTIYQAEQMLDYVAEKPATKKSAKGAGRAKATKSPAKKTAKSRPKIARRRAK